MENRFWSKVVKTSDCWVWVGARRPPGGYGNFYLCEANGKKVYKAAHHVAWFLKYGVWPLAHLHLCHKCDHPWCVNPDHLFVGTALDNQRDRIAKGRGGGGGARRGPDHHLTTLTWCKVREIRQSKLSAAKLAKLYKVSSGTIFNVKHRKVWVENP